MALIMEINSVEEVVKINNTILLYLLQTENEDLPIMLTLEAKNNIMDFLRRTYTNNQINKLINFFDRMKVGEYLYVYPYIELGDECIDFLKESLKYYNLHLGEDYVIDKMKEYFVQINEAKKILDNFEYKFNIYAPEKVKKYFGETNKKKRKCIYCGGCMEDNTAEFKENAHAIPEALGNKTYFQCEECDNCNDFFAKNVEEDMCNWLSMVRLKVSVK